MAAQIVLDLPPSLNKMYTPVRGRIILSDAARNWKLYAQLVIQSQWKDEPLEGEVVVYCYFYGSLLDSDNGLKGLFDAMNGIVYLDDSQIVEFHVYVSRGKKIVRRVEVEIHRKQGSSI